MSVFKLLTHLSMYSANVYYMEISVKENSIFPRMSIFSERNTSQDKTCLVRGRFVMFFVTEDLFSQTNCKNDGSQN